MTTEPIIESDMTFGPYPDGHCFYLENSEIYKKIKAEGIKTAEFLLLQIQQNETPTILIVEAKTSAPNLSNNQSEFDTYIDQIRKELTESKFDISFLDKVKKKLARSKKDTYFEDIREKFANSLALFVAVYLQRHATSNSELSDYFKKLELSSVNFLLILVIKNSEKEWLPPLEDKLKKVLKPTAKLWNLTPTSVIVLNEEGARRRGLIN